MDKIHEKLISVGVSPHLCGFDFLHDAIELAIEDPSIAQQLTKRLYPEAGAKYEKTGQNVERNIRTAIECAALQPDGIEFNRLFSNTRSRNTMVPKNGTFIKTMVLVCGE